MYTCLRINDVVIWSHIDHVVVVVGLNNIATVNKPIVIVVSIAINISLLYVKIAVLLL